MQDSYKSIVDEVVVLGYRLSRTQLLLDAIIRLNSLQEGLTQEMLDDIDKKSEAIVQKMFPQVKNGPKLIVQ